MSTLGPEAYIYFRALNNRPYHGQTKAVGNYSVCMEIRWQKIFSKIEF